MTHDEHSSRTLLLHHAIGRNLDRLAVTLDELHNAATTSRQVPTFTDYIPIVYGAMPGTVTRSMDLRCWLKLWP
ncbi:hypothetical protein [Nocardia sp. NPDC046763]|uniref:hypothetical protein n=1 Tax=Nocardia sp. NPDC046763 TaxID=3155256 RepID=UPI0033DF3BA6